LERQLQAFRLKKNGLENPANFHMAEKNQKALRETNEMIEKLTNEIAMLKRRGR
jgi:hypothetical protein